MNGTEPYGLPELIGSVFIAVFFLGTISALDGMAWAWAIGKGLRVGLIVGATIGVLLGLFL